MTDIDAGFDLVRGVHQVGTVAAAWLHLADEGYGIPGTADELVRSVYAPQWQAATRAAMKEVAPRRHLELQRALDTVFQTYAPLTGELMAAFTIAVRRLAEVEQCSVEDVVAHLVQIAELEVTG